MDGSEKGAIAIPNDAARIASSLLLLLLLGCAVLVLCRSGGSPDLGWSDEIVYASMGRRIADGRGLTSSFYHHRAVLEGGVPMGDVHMPGHALTLALPFRLLGASEAAARLPSQVAFLISGVALFVLGLRCGGYRVAWSSGLLLYAWPLLGTYAVTAMAEATLVGLMAFWLLAYQGTLSRLTPGRAAGLGLLTGLALLHRETSVALIPPALLAVLDRRHDRSRRNLAAFALTLAPLAVLAHRLSQDRPRHPHFLEGLREAMTVGGLVGPPSGMAARNVEALVSGFGLTQALLLLWLGIPVLLLLSRGRAGAPWRQLDLLTAYLVLAHAATLIWVYPFRGWPALRVLLAVAPCLCLSAAARLARIRRGWWRVVASTCAILCVTALTLAAHRRLAADRREARLSGEASVARIEAATPRGRRIRTLMAHEAFLFGWRHYPAVVIWSLPDTPRELVRVVERAGVDAVLLPDDTPLTARMAARLERLGFATPARSGPRLYLRATEAASP
jgi:4-amino-4-deoxy-L-arabinose transferase-like glycosyltransferase